MRTGIVMTTRSAEVNGPLDGLEVVSKLGGGAPGSGGRRRYSDPVGARRFSTRRAKKLAPSGRSDRTAGAVLSELARRALTSAPNKSTRAGVGGFVPFESRGGLITNEQIDRLREQDAY
jgi:hypothetical protein